MKDCEYFKQLISDSLDMSLETDKQMKLESHLNECAACREFHDGVTNDARILKLLPVLNHDKPLPRVTQQKKNRRAWMGSKVSLPLPLAATILIVLVCWGTFGWLRPIAPPDQRVSSRRTITNVHIERLKPAQPVLLTRAEFETKGR